jgi:hypothetical protein
LTACWIAAKSPAYRPVMRADRSRSATRSSTALASVTGATTASSVRLIPSSSAA